MKSRPLCSLILAALAAQATSYAQSVTIVSAASYQPVVAPNSLASMFGANLSAATASATLDANGQLPTQLGGISVQVDGQAAPLIYVSPLQVNFLIPASVTPGSVNVTVQSASNSSTLTGVMQVQNTAAGIFTADASGMGAGSILNAVTYAGAPFLVQTPANAGDDKRTRLSIYGTGLRYAGNPSHDPAITNAAGNVTASGLDAAGNRYSFVVEYAGAAPGYFGLDQVNIVLPPELDVAGAVSLTVTAELSTSNIVTFQMGSLPAGSIGLAGLVLSTSFVNAGDSLTATVSLTGVARSLGFPVSLRASSPTVQIPLSVTVPAGQSSMQFSIGTSTVTAAQTVTLTAQANGTTETAGFEIDPPNSAQLTNFLVAPSNIQGGQSASATVSLSGPAPAAGATVLIGSDNSVTSPPATVKIPFGSASATFQIPTATVTTAQTANLTATFGKSALTAQLTVIPILQLTLANSSVLGGNSVGGTITLGQPAPAAGVTLNVQCDNRTIAQPPLTVSVPSGQTSVQFTITTIPVAVARTVTITVTFGGATQSASLTVNPPGSVTLAALTITPDHVTGGASATGTATLGAQAPLGGTSINLSSSNVFAAQVPQFLSVPEGAVSIKFTITTIHVTSTQTITITATAGAVSQTATLTVQ